MNLDDRIFNYCERAQDPAFWAEPLNATSNLAFIVAAALATRDWLAAPPDRRGVPEALLVALTYVIGVGSFLFHTYATRWASYADTIPIGIFMLSYVTFLLRRLVHGHWLLVAAGFAIFVFALRGSLALECDQTAVLPVTMRAGARCFNGSLGYLPALAALAIATGWLAALGRRSWRPVGLATLVFAVSMTFRTLDLEICDATRIASHLSGTHFLWHILNATTLYLLLRAAIVDAEPRPPN